MLHGVLEFLNIDGNGEAANILLFQPISWLKVLSDRTSGDVEGAHRKYQSGMSSFDTMPCYVSLFLCMGICLLM